MNAVELAHLRRGVIQFEVETKSTRHNIAAYRLAELLGIDDMLPVYVERSWAGNPGSISWWLPGEDGRGGVLDQPAMINDRLTLPPYSSYEASRGRALHIL